METGIHTYHLAFSPEHLQVCEQLAAAIAGLLPEARARIWHGHPVWFIEDNPIVGYSLQKKSIRLMFWSGADFEEEGLPVKGGKFKDASVFYNRPEDIETECLERCLKKSRDIQWDYKNLVKRKGKLERLK